MIPEAFEFAAGDLAPSGASGELKGYRGRGSRYNRYCKKNHDPSGACQKIDVGKHNVDVNFLGGSVRSIKLPSNHVLAARVFSEYGQQGQSKFVLKSDKNMDFNMKSLNVFRQKAS